MLQPQPVKDFLCSFLFRVSLARTLSHSIFNAVYVCDRRETLMTTASRIALSQFAQRGVALQQIIQLHSVFGHRDLQYSELLDN